MFAYVRNKENEWIRLSNTQCLDFIEVLKCESARKK